MDENQTVFISHNKVDKKIARDIALFLVAEDINVWVDEWEISAGDSIVDEIQSGLKKCTHFLILWSKNADTSKWVRSELKTVIMKAIESGRPKIIPVKLDSTPLPELIIDRKYVSYNSGNEEDRKEIVHAVTGNSPSMNFVKAVVEKYHEVIYDNGASGPFGMKYCPSCGSEKLVFSSALDEAHDEMYYLVKCKDCGYSDWTQ